MGKVQERAEERPFVGKVVTYAMDFDDDGNARGPFEISAAGHEVLVEDAVLSCAEDFLYFRIALDKAERMWKAYRLGKVGHSA
jgi:hypothetical protein